MNAGKVIFATLVIFVAGIFTGGLLVSLAIRLNGQHPFKPFSQGATNSAAQAVNPWQLRNRELVKRMERELNLTPEQLTVIGKLVAASQERTKTLWKPITPQMNKETFYLHNEIRDVLNPDQKKRFDGFMKSHPPADRLRHGTNNVTLTNAVAWTNSVTAALTNGSNAIISTPPGTSNAAATNP